MSGGSRIGHEPHNTLAELRAKLLSERGECFKTVTIWRFFRRRKIRRKKAAHAAEQEWLDVGKKR